MSEEPKIVGFLCNWCAFEAADAAGRAEKEYYHNLRIIKVLCTGRLDPQFILEAFRDGAEGVITLGCHPDECHYKEGNLNWMRRSFLLKKTLADFGLEEDRLVTEWVSAGESEKFIGVVAEMVEKIRKLGPLKLRR